MMNQRLRRLSNPLTDTASRRPGSQCDCCDYISGIELFVDGGMAQI
jgi:hypothetical protein